MKQSLKIKPFVGTTENAVQTQIWTALIAMLLIKYLQRDLFLWLDDPLHAPLALDGIHDVQMELAFNC